MLDLLYAGRDYLVVCLVFLTLLVSFEASKHVHEDKRHPKHRENAQKHEKSPKMGAQTSDKSH